MTIDLTRLPARALFDTSVLIPALRTSDPRTSAKDAPAKELFNAMVSQRNAVLIASVALAELLRKTPMLVLPRVKHVRTVAFDTQCAEVLAKYFPPIVLKEEQASLAGLPAAYWKYDAMIVAIGIRYGAECIITEDAGQTKLAIRAGLSALRPEFYQKSQMALPLPSTKPTDS
jgi:predicted nucleic acid-binding protein